MSHVNTLNMPAALDLGFPIARPMLTPLLNTDSHEHLHTSILTCSPHSLSDEKSSILFSS